MRKRFTMALAAGALAAAMLPGVASAEWPGERPEGGPTFMVIWECQTTLGNAQGTAPAEPAGAQGFVKRFLTEFLEEALDTYCLPGTVTHTFTRIS